jgi:hypothetical protein
MYGACSTHGEKRNTIFGGKSEKMNPIRRLELKWDNNIRS